MDDLISRKAAIDSIEKHLRFGDELYPLTDADKILNHGFEIAVSCVYNLPSAQHWIPCSERLPEKHGYYIVQTDGSRNHVIDIAEYGLFWHNMKQEMMWNKASKILAWMPLPKPYKTDKGSGIDED